MATGQTTTANFDVSEFVKSGWIFSLSDGRFVVGWGPLEFSDRATAQQPTIFAPDFYLETKKPWLSTASWALFSRDQLKASLPDNPVTALNWVEPSRDDFFKTLQFLKETFYSGLAKKAVPVVFAKSKSKRDSNSVLALVSQALKAPSELRIYGFWNESEGMLGATPEVLFKRSSNRIESMALAGTRRGQLTIEDERNFLGDRKERHEHQLVIDDIRACFARWGTPLVGETRVLRLPTLAHIFTPIEVECSSEVNFNDIARTLHPTPALGVAPRELGLKWMKTWDQTVRDRFGAPFGLSWAGEIEECLVAIRNVQWHDNDERDWKLGSGCGIVSESEPENEWQELKAKRESVRRLLGV